MPEISYVPEVSRVSINPNNVPILLPPQVIFSLVEAPERVDRFPDPEALQYEVSVEEVPHGVPEEEAPILIPDTWEDDSSEDEDGYLSEASSVSVDW